MIAVMWSIPTHSHRVPWGEVPENCVCFRYMRSFLATVTATSTYGSQSHGASARWPLSTCEITVERVCKPEKWGKTKPGYTDTEHATPPTCARVNFHSFPVSWVKLSYIISRESECMEYSKGICFKQPFVTLGLLTLGALCHGAPVKKRFTHRMQAKLMQIFQTPIPFFLKAKNISYCFLVIISYTPLLLYIKLANFRIFSSPPGSLLWPHCRVATSHMWLFHFKLKLIKGHLGGSVS